MVMTFKGSGLVLLVPFIYELLCLLCLQCPRRAICYANCSECCTPNFQHDNEVRPPDCHWWVFSYVAVVTDDRLMTVL